MISLVFNWLLLRSTVNVFSLSFSFPILTVVGLSTTTFFLVLFCDLLHQSDLFHLKRMLRYKYAS